jgi:long-chain acyl-CoA synthetase
MYPGAHARQNADEPALVGAETGARMTYGELEARANRLAHLLRRQGLQRLDHVAFLLENSFDNVVCQSAGERTGVYYTCVSSHLTAGEAAWIINDSTARVVVTSRALLDVARNLPERCPQVERWLMVDRPADLTSFEDLDEALAAMPDGPIPDEELGAAMLYSSGTTGRPKGVLRPMPEGDPLGEVAFLNAVKEVFQLREGMTFLQPAPLYHSGPQASTGCAIRLGATVVLMERFDARLFLESVERHRVTHTMMVPTMFSRLLALPDDVRSAYDLSSLEAVVHVGAPCPPAVKHRMIEWFGPILWENYGATEAAGGTGCSSQEWLDRPGTVGRSRLGEILILDEERRRLPVGEIGEVWFKGRVTFQYFNDPAKTAATRDTEGTMSSTGDIGRLDEDGYLYLADRKDFMIISGGVNIYPQEIEYVLADHPAVADVAVIGVPHHDMGEQVKAIVELAPGAAPGPELEAALIAHCREHLARYKCPRSVDFIDEMPRTPVGKLAKNRLKAVYWESATAGSEH